MNFNDIDLEKEIITAIENDYGMPIVRVPVFEQSDEPCLYNIKAIFSDLTLIEGTVKFIPVVESVTFKIDGIYY